MIIQMQNIDFGGQRGHKDKKSISLKNRCVRYAKSPIAHETFQTMPGLISCAGVTRRWGLLSRAQHAVMSLALSIQQVEVPQKYHIFVQLSFKNHIHDTSDCHVLCAYECVHMLAEAPTRATNSNHMNEAEKMCSVHAVNLFQWHLQKSLLAKI